MPDRENRFRKLNRHRRVGRVGEMEFAVYQIIVNLSSEGRLNLCRGSVKKNLIAAGRD